MEVPARTLPQVMDENRLDRIGFHKMDCEGAEGSILHSTPLRYLSRIEKLALEFHDDLSILDHRAIRNLLARAGFRTVLRRYGNAPYGYKYARNQG